MKMAYDQREPSSEEEVVAVDDLRRGPWTVEEDLLLVNYIAAHGEGRWNALARCAGLRRTGKSCRLRWLNYLRPDLRRGSMTAREQLLILELHARWGNRWSKIAQHLPGRTDNEIKNYWRTRVQKHARHLRCDVGSQRFKDLVRHLWMPRLLERMHSGVSMSSQLAVPPVLSEFDCWPVDALCLGSADVTTTAMLSSSSTSADGGMKVVFPLVATADESAPAGCNIDGPYKYTDSTAARNTVWQPPQTHGQDSLVTQHQQPEEQQFGADVLCWWSESLPGPGLYADIGLPDLAMGGGETMWGTCTDDDLWYTYADAGAMEAARCTTDMRTP